MSTSAVSIAVDGPVATVRLVRPDKRDAFERESRALVVPRVREQIVHRRRESKAVLGDESRDKSGEVRTGC